jgi:hypothetical protein
LHFRAFENLTFFSYLDLSQNRLASNELTDETFQGKYLLGDYEEKRERERNDNLDSAQAGVAGCQP